MYNPINYINTKPVISKEEIEELKREVTKIYSNFTHYSKLQEIAKYYDELYWNSVGERSAEFQRIKEQFKKDMEVEFKLQELSPKVKERLLAFIWNNRPYKNYFEIYQEYNRAVNIFRGFDTKE